jgi:hypothetical protein
MNNLFQFILLIIQVIRIVLEYIEYYQMHIFIIEFLVKYKMLSLY